MAVEMRTELAGLRKSARCEPTPKRVRVRSGDATIVDSTSAVLVWEPQQHVPSYAFPTGDIAADLTPRTHTARGIEFDVVVGGLRVGQAVRLADPGLQEYVLLHVDDGRWYEEDDPIDGHPRDPFHRIDVRSCSRLLTIGCDGERIAESADHRMLFETGFPFARFYLPVEHVLIELVPSATRTWCPYKGEATYFDAHVGRGVLRDVAWSYPTPFDESRAITGLVAFYQEKLDVRLERR
ncbi:DUF427 domain-containing protein [Rhodococcus triatomae]|uniref:Uncharacterized conserved protein, DUF427 family n=1 Tax=Rhodococcus triatomae TaxID=300028 RepID=A0A1G8FK99_9NOCA|nr:DUF427 domain-containing protein [Rhodococcus triatomae]QNG19506.1 DUF427 domain-containing protein [Rhodococcus triatomae]QNG24579.1 DUF427 domain-containing protein [Rhodococcus triatomae]SDH82528.1 Uncharacterized conserved protein, DUF427 family [Rhodococcus triatomae]